MLPVIDAGRTIKLKCHDPGNTVPVICSKNPTEIRIIVIRAMLGPKLIFFIFGNLKLEDITNNTAKNIVTILYIQNITNPVLIIVKISETIIAIIRINKTITFKLKYFVLYFNIFFIGLNKYNRKMLQTIG